MEAGLRRIVNTLPDPRAEPQYRVTVDDHRYRIDFAYPHIKLGIEAHGLKWHMGRERWIKDLRRDRRMKTIGWTLLYFPWDDIQLEPRRVATEILEIRTSLERALLNET